MPIDGHAPGLKGADAARYISAGISTDYFLSTFLIYQTPSKLKDAETGQRGYIITGEKAYLEPYYKGINFVKSETIQNILAKSENQKALSQDIQELKKLTSLKLTELQNVIDRYDHIGFEAAKKEVTTNIGKNTMDKIRDAVGNILLIKENYLKENENKINDYFKFIIDLVVSINILYLILISICISTLYLKSK